MSFEEAQRKIDSAEFAEWQAYRSIHPFEPERADVRMAMLCTLVANALKGKNQRAAKMADFMPFLKEQKKPTQADVAAKFKVAGLAYNALNQARERKRANAKRQRMK